MSFAEPKPEIELVAREADEPTGKAERLIAIDVVRGVAVLGILAMNILSIGLPGAARLNPMIAGGFQGKDRYLWWIGYLFFDEKMIALFSMLFGAGLVLQAERAIRSGHSPARLFYRRMFVLLLIGLVHAYLVWDGDILVTYALCGMLLYPLRRLSPGVLILLGVLVMLLAIPFGLLIADVLSEARTAAERVEQLVRDGSPVTDADRAAAADWASIRSSFRPSAEELAVGLSQARVEGYIEHVRRKAPEAMAVHTQLFVAAFLWLVGGRILIGMALMKLGIFSGARTRQFYLVLTLVGFGVGVPLVYLCGARLIAREFDPVAIFGGGLLWNTYAGMFVALGHIGLTISLLKAELLTGLTDRLAAVGRMALTNYLVQSIICTTLFCGWGFGLIGRLDRTALYGVMLSVWLLQLFYSPIWLARFRFGPVEWLWRTLTYGRWQPLGHRR
jgi:uncharacterized protein